MMSLFREVSQFGMFSHIYNNSCVISLKSTCGKALEPAP